MRLNCPLVVKVLEHFIRDELRKSGFEKIVVGLSGGIDSALSCFLAARSLGASNVYAVMMPYQTSSQESLSDANAVVETLQVNNEMIEITPIVDGYFGSRAKSKHLRRGNVMARARMIVLFDKSLQYEA